jgi:hypothetical protein
VIEPGREAPRTVDVDRSQASAAARVAPRDVAPQVRPRTVVVAPTAGRIPSDGAHIGGGVVVGGAPLGGKGAVCRTCGRQVPSDLHFCRCGTQVSGSTAPTRDGDAVDLDVQGMNRQRFDRLQRRANGGRRPRFDEPLSARTWAFRTCMALVVVGAVGSQVPPWGDDVRSWVSERIDAALFSAPDA